MLTPDLIRPHIRNGCISLTKVTAAKKKSLSLIAQSLLQMTDEMLGATREEWMAAMREGMPASSSEGLAWKALLKLIEDACDFESAKDVKHEQLRADVFSAAASARKASSHTHGFERISILTDAGERFGLSADQVEQHLFSDRKSEQRLRSCGYGVNDTEQLISDWSFGRVKAVLLRAISVTATISDPDAKKYREVFRKLKFHQLLYEVEKESQGYRIHMDGPASLFTLSAKYGLKLALVLASLVSCQTCEIQATVSWGKKRRKDLVFNWSSESIAQDAPQISSSFEEMDLELDEMVQAILKSTDLWSVKMHPDILHIPGAGVCVPDLAFVSKKDGKCVYFEKMGFWSRAAVWKRVEMIEAGLEEPVVFAVSERLRVSDRALGKNRPSALYVYKGKMIPSKVLQKIDELHDRES
jgi:uncharacterized protein